MVFYQTKQKTAESVCVCMCESYPGENTPKQAGVFMHIFAPIHMCMRAHTQSLVTSWKSVLNAHAWSFLVWASAPFLLLPARSSIPYATATMRFVQHRLHGVIVDETPSPTRRQWCPWQLNSRLLMAFEMSPDLSPASSPTLSPAPPSPPLHLVH